MNFQNTLPFIITQITTTYRNLLEKSMVDLGLHSGQVFILIELWNIDGISQIELANKLKVSAPTINKMVKSLTQNEFVSCRRDESDTRIVKVFLTTKGVEIKPQVEQQWLQIEQKIVQNLTETEKLVLGQLFEKLKDGLSNH